jgi:hypothetical protein
MGLDEPLGHPAIGRSRASGTLPIASRTITTQPRRSGATASMKRFF